MIPPKKNYWGFFYLEICVFYLEYKDKLYATQGLNRLRPTSNN